MKFIVLKSIIFLSTIISFVNLLPIKENSLSVLQFDDSSLFSPIEGLPNLSSDNNKIVKRQAGRAAARRRQARIRAANRRQRQRHLQIQNTLAQLQNSISQLQSVVNSIINRPTTTKQPVTNNTPDSGAGSNPDSGAGSNPDSGAGSNPDSGTGSYPDSGADSNPDSGTGSNPDTDYDDGRYPGGSFN
uniref:BZIP domain-containing protein n=1 Tax=Parastrongyloides trichosuri TaxID=131310 RepID=A0A0N4Z5Q2_PARTI